MRELVLRSFKGRKRELRFSFIMLALVYMCGIMAILFQESFFRSRENLRYDTYGEWTGAVFGAREETEQMIKEMESTEQIGKIIMLGSAWMDAEQLGEAGYADGAARDLGRIQMLEGCLPSDSSEIALSETTAARLPERVKVGDTIEIAWTKQGKTNPYTLSGIVKPWGREWQTEKHTLPNVILGTGEGKQREVYLLFRNDSLEEMNLVQRWMEDRGEETYVYNDKAYPLDVTVLDEFLQNGEFVVFLVLIAAIFIGYLTMLVQKPHRHSLTILRGMGAGIGDILRLAIWETAFLWGAAFLAGMVMGVLAAGIMLFAVHTALKMPIQQEIRADFLLEYTACVTAVYFMCSLAVALTAARSRICTTFRLDSGLLDRSAPPKLKRVEKITFFTCLKRKWAFYNKIYIGRCVISIVVMAASAICFQLFIEAEQKYEFWMKAVEYAYYYEADHPEEGLTEGQVEKLEKIDGVKSVEKEVLVNSSTMEQSMEGTSGIKVAASAFKDNMYVDTHRKCMQKLLNVPVDKEGDYFFLWELRGISPQDEEQLSCYARAAGLGCFDRERFISGEECVLILPPYQIRDLGSGKEPVYVNVEKMDASKDVYTYELDETAIALGDTVKICTPWGEGKIRVGSVITSPEADLPVDAQIVAVSEKFVGLLCGLEEVRYTSVKMNLDETMDIATTGTEIEGYFEALGKGANLMDGGSAMRGFAEDSLFDGTQYLFALTAMWLIYMLMMYHGNQACLKNEGKRIGVFRALGMSSARLKSMYLLENLSEDGMIILLSFAIVAGEFLIRLKKEDPYDSVNILLRSLADQTEKVWLLLLAVLLAAAVFLGVSIVTLYIPIKNLSDSNIAVSLGNGERI